jgi:hypothetical protein
MIGGDYMNNFNLPELEKLEEVVSQYDFLIQEAVFYTKEEKERAEFLARQLVNLIDQL